MSRRRLTGSLTGVWVLAFAPVLLFACEAYRHQHRAATGTPPSDERPAREAVRPGAEFRELPTAQQLAVVRGQVEELKANLAREGKYNCCVEPSCNECLFNDGECVCRLVVEQDGPCCGECTAAWLEGRGQVEGVDPWELLERKKRQGQE